MQSFVRHFIHFTVFFIKVRDIDERHLLRLGYGAKELETTIDYSKWGRVAHLAKLRDYCLGQAEFLATTLSNICFLKILR